jgi:uncharacterized membrane protein YkvA (DUF1232 family)
MNFLSQAKQSFLGVWRDERLPTRDKRLVILLAVLVLSPVDFIPDWIPIFGMIDDVFMVAFIMDYFFNVLDEKIILTHYSFGMKSFLRLRRFGQLLGSVAPRRLRHRIWKYRKGIHS